MLIRQKMNSNSGQLFPIVLIQTSELFRFFPGFLLMIAIGIINGIALCKLLHQLLRRYRFLSRERGVHITGHNNEIRILLPDGMNQAAVIFSKGLVMKIR